jgi:hypothetical protein
MQDSRIHRIPNSNYPTDGNVKSSLVTIVEILITFISKVKLIRSNFLY